MSVRARLLAALALLAVPVTAGIASGAVPKGTVTGRLAGVAIPSAGSGEAFVRAVSLSSGVVVGRGTLNAQGRYSLKLPKGVYALIPSVVSSTRRITPKVSRVALKAGQRKSVALRRAAALAQRRPIVTFLDGAFTGGTGDLALVQKGLVDMLITDLVAAPATAACQITVVERSAKFMAAYNVEQVLRRSGRGDPSTFAQPGRLIEPTRGIRGRLVQTGDRLRIDAEIYKWSNRRTVARTSAEGRADNIFAVEQILAERLIAKLCEQPGPITGTFSGLVDYNQVQGAPAQLKIDWSGTVEFAPIALNLTPGGVTYKLRGGNLTAHIAGQGEASDCAVNGTASFDYATLFGGQPALAMAVTEGATDKYRFFLSPGSAAITATLSGCQAPGDEGTMRIYPLAAVHLLPTGEQTTQTEGLFQGIGSQPGSAADGAYTWNWNLTSG